MMNHRRALAASVPFALVFMSYVVVAQTPPSRPSQSKVRFEPIEIVSPADGPGMFKSYCAPCHGVSGKGDGPSAKALSPKPADLTEFSKRRGGKFSFKDLEDKLDGMAMAPAHGDTDMPVWGPIFRRIGHERLRVANLVKHVESLQVR